MPWWIGKEQRRQSRSCQVHVGQHPERTGVLVVEDPAAGRDRGRDAGLGHIVGNGDVDVEAVALGAGRVHLLEPEPRPDADRIDDDVDHPALSLGRQLLIAQQGDPERADGVDVHGVDGHFHPLGTGRFAGHIAGRGQ